MYARCTRYQNHRKMQVFLQDDINIMSTKVDTLSILVDAACKMSFTCPIPAIAIG